jgi:hypothetical protein
LHALNPDADLLLRPRADGDPEALRIQVGATRNSSHDPNGYAEHVVISADRDQAGA